MGGSTSKHNKILGELSGARLKIADLEMQISTLKAGDEGSDHVVKTLKAKRDELMEKVNSITSDKITIEISNNELKNAKQLLESEVASLKTSLSEQDKINKKLGKKVGGLAGANQILKKNLDQAQIKLKEVNLALEVLKDKSTDLMTQLTASNSRINKMTRDIANYKTSVKKMTSLANRPVFGLSGEPEYKCPPQYPHLMAKGGTDRGPVLYCFKDDDLENGKGSCNIPNNAIKDVTKFTANRTGKPEVPATGIGTGGDGQDCAQYFKYFSCPPEYPNLAHYNNDPKKSVYCYAKDKYLGTGCRVPKNALLSPEFMKNKKNVKLGTFAGVGHYCDEIDNRRSDTTGCMGVYTVASRPQGGGVCYGNPAVGSKEMHKADCEYYGGSFKNNKFYECAFPFPAAAKQSAFQLFDSAPPSFLNQSIRSLFPNTLVDVIGEKPNVFA